MGGGQQQQLLWSNVSFPDTVPRDDRTNQTNIQKIYIVGMLNPQLFDWAYDIYNLTIQLLNNKTDGFHDDIFNVQQEQENDVPHIEYYLSHEDCDETDSVRSYWTIRNNYHHDPIHGIVGPTCSGATIAVARIAGLEQVPQVGPASVSPLLSNKMEFPYFSRLIAPNDAGGAVGALVSLLHTLRWHRVSVIDVDTQFAKDTSLAFRKLWSSVHIHNATTTTTTSNNNNSNNETWIGEVAYSNTVSLLLSNGSIDERSVVQVLNGVPTHDPTINSRVIVLIAGPNHAFPILQLAHTLGFQKDTVWVGLSWIEPNNTGYTVVGDWIQQVPYPGYIGIQAYRNSDAIAMDYLNRLRYYQLQHKQEPWDTIVSPYVGYIVDSLVALVTALSNVHPTQRLNGTAVTQELRSLSFRGVTGPVNFTSNGDRANPLYSIYNFQKSAVDGTYNWMDVGTVGIDGPAVFYNISTLCFAQIGCNVGAIPLDRYPIPTPKAPLWVSIVIPIIVTLLLILLVTYWRKSLKHTATVASMNAMQQEMDELHRINKKLAELDHEVEDVTRKKDALILQRANFIQKPETWHNNNTEEQQVLVEVSPLEDQYWDVSDQLQETMKHAHIATLWRIQNQSLWAYYSFHKHRLLHNGIDINESVVWHGTSSIDPALVYNDRQDGFRMQYSEKGFWGRGLYFAESSKYANEYAYHPFKRPAAWVETDGRSVGLIDEREIFLVKLLVGESIEMDRSSPEAKMECSALTIPPINDRTNLNYNTVRGYTGDSQVWVVYENGRAYPDYLVRYYVGRRDAKRTPYKSRKDAIRQRPEDMSSVPTPSTAMNLESDDVSEPWKYHGSSSERLDSSRDIEENSAHNNDDTHSTTPPSSPLRNSIPSYRPAECAGYVNRMPLWEYAKGDGASSLSWEEYDPYLQTKLEVSYQEFVARQSSSIRIVDDTYEIDFVTMTQTNRLHPDHGTCSIRRVP